MLGTHVGKKIKLNLAFVEFGNSISLAILARKKKAHLIKCLNTIFGINRFFIKHKPCLWIWLQAESSE